MPLNVPNILTWLRILMIPLVIGVFYVPEVWLSSWHQTSSRRRSSPRPR